MVESHGSALSNETKGVGEERVKRSHGVFCIEMRIWRHGRRTCDEMNRDTIERCMKEARREEQKK
jgi:hypothetical protein